MKNKSLLRVKEFFLVLVFALVYMYLLGIGLGLIDFFLIQSFRLSFSGMFYWLLAITLCKVIRSKVEFVRVEHYIVAFTFMLLGYAMIETIPSYMAYGIRFSNLIQYFNLWTYLKNLFILLNPVYLFADFYGQAIQLLFVGVGTYLGYNQIKN